MIAHMRPSWKGSKGSWHLLVAWLGWTTSLKRLTGLRLAQTGGQVQAGGCCRRMKAEGGPPLQRWCQIRAGTTAHAPLN